MGNGRSCTYYREGEFCNVRYTLHCNTSTTHVHLSLRRRGGVFDLVFRNFFPFRTWGEKARMARERERERKFSSAFFSRPRPIHHKVATKR